MQIFPVHPGTVNPCKRTKLERKKRIAAHFHIDSTRPFISPENFRIALINEHLKNKAKLHTLTIIIFAETCMSADGIYIYIYFF